MDKGPCYIYELLALIKQVNEFCLLLQVIVRREGKIRLLCKGADSVIYERLGDACADVEGTTTNHLHVNYRFVF